MDGIRAAATLQVATPDLNAGPEPSAAHGARAAPERFIAEARIALTESSHRQVEAWRLGEESSWEVDLDEGRVRFLFSDGTILVAPIQIVGTYNARDGTFLWAWGHKTLPAPLLEHARLARRWGEAHRVAEYCNAIVNCEPDDVWNFAAVTARLAGRQGIYRGRSGSVWMYLTYGELDVQASARAASSSTSTALVPVAAKGYLPARSPRGTDRPGPEIGLGVEGHLQRLGSRLAEMVQRPIDCARVTSRLRLTLARRRGQLEPLALIPPSLAAERGEPTRDAVFVPPYYAEQKRRLDHLILGGLVRYGIGNPAYAATPDFAGRSLVPASIQIEVSGPVSCVTVMRIWDPEDEAAGRGTAAEGLGLDAVEPGNGGDEGDPGGASVADGRPPQSIVEAFIRDYFDWNVEAARSDLRLPGEAVADGSLADERLSDGRLTDGRLTEGRLTEGRQAGSGGRLTDRRERIHRAYRALLHRYCAAGVGPSRIAWGDESIFDPIHSRIVAEVHIGARALVVVGRPEVDASRPFSTYDFEFVRDADRWALVDIAVVDGFDRLSMLKRRHAPVH